jgi:isovaleryl-CoA dehydrogenase
MAEELRGKARRFASTEILPHTDEIERTGNFPPDLWTKLGRAGFLGLTVSQEFGGAGLGYLEHFVVHEEISRASPAVGFSYLVHSHACVNQIFLHGTDAQRRRFLPGLVSGEAYGALAMTEKGAGSDVLGMTTLAEQWHDGYRLNGRKAWICNATRADIVVVYARSSRENRKISAFVLEKNLPGFRASPALETFGVRGAGTADIALIDCQVTEEHLLGRWENGTPILMGGLSYERFVAGGGALGLMQACLDIAVHHARTRQQFGQPIGAFQLDQQIQAIADQGRLGWQKQSGYNQRALVESQIGRFKQVIGPMLRFHTAEAQAIEIAIAVEVLNRMLDLGGPNSVRVA